MRLITRTTVDVKCGCIMFVSLEFHNVLFLSDLKYLCSISCSLQFPLIHYFRVTNAGIADGVTRLQPSSNGKRIFETA